MILPGHVARTTSRVAAYLNDLPQARLKAAVRAANRAMTSVRAASARRLQQEYPGVKIAELKKRLAFKRASAADPVAWVQFSGRRMSMYGRFGMRAYRGRRGQFGVRFTRLPWRVEGVSGDAATREILDRAFRQRGNGGRAIVMARWTKLRQSAEVLVAPGPARAFGERGVGEEMLALARARFSIEFEREQRFQRKQLMTRALAVFRS